MPEPSCSSVRVFSLDRDRVVRSLREAAQRLVDEDPRVLRVLLFGSLLRGNYGAMSDADVAVILSDSPEPLWFRRIPSLLSWFSGIGVAVDLFPYTLSDLETGKGNLFFEEVQAGQVLAERPRL